MSQPKRYLATLYGMEPFGSGDWVQYSDYADLAAENERLRKASFTTAVPSEEYERVKELADRMYETAMQDSTGLWVLGTFQDWKNYKQEKGIK